MKHGTGLEFIRAIHDALKLPPGVQRVVIEADVHGPLRVYVKGVVNADGMAAVVRAVADVAVSDRGEVAVIELPEPHVVGE